MRLNGMKLRSWAGLFTLALVMIGCSDSAPKSQNLPLACETAECSCTSTTDFFAKSQPLEWNPDGTAKCSSGYQLHMKPPPSQRWTVQ